MRRAARGYSFFEVCRKSRKAPEGEGGRPGVSRVESKFPVAQSCVSWLPYGAVSVYRELAEPAPTYAGKD